MGDFTTAGMAILAFIGGAVAFGVFVMAFALHEARRLVDERQEAKFNAMPDADLERIICEGGI